MQKQKLHFRNLLCGRDCKSPGLALSLVMMVWLQTRMEEHMLWCSNTSADGAVGAYSPSNHLTPDDNIFDTR